MAMIKGLSEKYFYALGKPKPGAPFNALDLYRFKLAYRFLAPGSVLDVGTYFGDFLKIVREHDARREIYGTEVNNERADLSNINLGSEVVRVDFRNGMLSTFEDSSIDNVVCTEVIEHVPDHELAVHELCRVGKKRIIISVPYNERILSHLCIHCCQYTPSSGHLHSYKIGSFDKMLPEEWIIFREGTLGNSISRRIASKGNSKLFTKYSEAIFGRILKRWNRWLYVVLTKKLG